jgi:hypothetical protein
MPASGAAETGSVQIIQAVPKATVKVLVDGKQVTRSARVGAVLGPLSVAAGKHTVRFVDSSGDVSLSAELTVRPGSNTDVVLHRPASISGDPVVNVYRTPRASIGPGKARVLIAHTATVAPADVRVDGKVVFTNIANGEYAEADVPAGGHEVELLPSGQTKNPILVDVGHLPFRGHRSGRHRRARLHHHRVSRPCGWSAGHDFSAVGWCNAARDLSTDLVVGPGGRCHRAGKSTVVGPLARAPRDDTHARPTLTCGSPAGASGRGHGPCSWPR